MRRKKTQSSEHREPLAPSRRGGKGGPRELSITTLWRACANPRAGGKPVPYVRLSGRWLERFGFARGSRVVVAAEQGRLVLTLADPPRCS
jgi:hypothetical protein